MAMAQVNTIECLVCHAALPVRIFQPGARVKCPHCENQSWGSSSRPSIASPPPFRWASCCSTRASPVVSIIRKKRPPWPAKAAAAPLRAVRGRVRRPPSLPGLHRVRQIQKKDQEPGDRAGALRRYRALAGHPPRRPPRHVSLHDHHRPLALYCAIRYWNAPRSIVPRNRLRLVLAIVISLLEILFWAGQIRIISTALRMG